MSAFLHRLLARTGLQLSRLPGPPPVQAGAGSHISPHAEIRGFAANIRIGKNVLIEAHAMLECPDAESSIEIGDNSIIKSHALLLADRGGSIRLGRHCSVNPFTVLYGHGGLTIGDDVRIATHCVVVPANHVFANPDAPIRSQGLTREGISIGDDVWLGAGARVLDGCTIGRGSVIAAGAVLTRSVPADSIVAGVPGRVIASRRS